MAAVEVKKRRLSSGWSEQNTWSTCVESSPLQTILSLWLPSPRLFRAILMVRPDSLSSSVSPILVTWLNRPSPIDFLR